jgi:hypothetical protein
MTSYRIELSGSSRRSTQDVSTNSRHISCLLFANKKSRTLLRFFFCVLNSTTYCHQVSKTLCSIRSGYLPVHVNAILPFGRFQDDFGRRLGVEAGHL